MNLVSYEIVTCQEKEKGVLILSKLVGAAPSVCVGAILVNPWSITEVVSKTLNRKSKEREKRHKLNVKHETNCTTQEWAETFVSE